MYLNLYATPAIIACILSTLIGIYVFYKNPKNIQNRVFALFILFVVVFSAGEVMLRLSSNSEEGLLWGRIGYLGVIFVPIGLLHLSFVFPRERSAVRINKYLLFVMYLTGIVMLCAFNLIVSIQDVQLGIWGHRLALNSSTSFIGIWGFAISVFSVFNFLRAYRISKSVVEKKQIKHIFYGSLIAAIIILSTNVVSPLFGIIIFPMGTIAVSILTIFVGAVIVKYNLFRFKPMIEPVIEEKKAGPKRYKLDSGKGYITQEKSGKHGYEIFINQITHDISGLCITKYPPQKIRDKYRFETTPLLWFTFEQSDKEKIINPKKLDIELSPQIENFVKKRQPTIIYIDCFYEMEIVNGFDSAMGFLKDVSRLCKENNSNLLLSINPVMFEREQLEIINQEFLEVK